MPIFDRLDRMISRTVDRTFAVSFECHPAKATPNGRPGPDPDREVWIGKGILDQEPNYHAIVAGQRDRKGNDFRTLATGNSIELSVDRARYPQADQARQGDRVLLDDTRRFDVVSVRRDGLSRVVFQLVEIKR
jgi:hypothetical protein